MLRINTPTFFAAMPRGFLDKIRALKPDPAAHEPQGAESRHPHDPLGMSDGISVSTGNSRTMVHNPRRTAGGHP